MLSMMLSRAASGLLRALIQRIGEPPDNVLLSAFKTVDWRSLTFLGERHMLGLRVPGPDAMALVARLIDGIEEAEFSIPGQIVAEIAVVGMPARELDGLDHSDHRGSNDCGMKPPAAWVVLAGRD